MEMTTLIIVGVIVLIAIITIIQGYEVMSMRPIQLNLTLKDALSAQNIRVTVPTTVTVAISQDPLIR